MMTPTNPAALAEAAKAAVRMIPPAWPLASSVAVNPFLGHTDDTLAKAGERLARIGGVSVTMPRSWYLERIANGTVSDSDLSDALAACRDAAKPKSVEALKAAAAQNPEPKSSVFTIAQLATTTSGTDWISIIEDRFSAWASAYFDEGQALWAAPRSHRAWTAWREWAVHDLTPEIQGLKGFARFVSDAPQSPYDAVARSSARLGIGDQGLESYFHQLLLSLGGWAQYARYKLWEAELAGKQDETLQDLLAIRLLWEEALFIKYQADIESQWQQQRQAHSEPIAASVERVTDAILQESIEISAQREITEVLAEELFLPSPGHRPSLQAAFCIDVRSEVFRRALETLDTSIRTIGFAGFFGVFTSHKRHASDVEEKRLPVLLNPTVHSCAGSSEPAAIEKDITARYRARATRAWGRFKLSAVSSFAFVEAMGPVYIWKLLRDSFGLHDRHAPNDPKPRFTTQFSLTDSIDAAETVLRAMSLTENFGRVVMLAGHGANVVNNPHESSLHCGACGGYSGEVNARLIAQLLNEKDLRSGLSKRGIDIPSDTLFVAALHDTTTDKVTLYDGDVASADHANDLKTIRGWLAAAGKIARSERALRLPRARSSGDVSLRARDWSEVRPEWALAGCKAFIAAPRATTSGRNLHGRTFLHDYDWKQDEARGFPVLELIMTAPVVVASWISLQYYGSATAPEKFGSGNKLLHNVVGGIGVLEGNGGLMRAGLPWQSVYNGKDFEHEPLRLTVMIDAPVEAMTRILEKHPNVRELFDNRWLHLLALDASGQVVARYDRDLLWIHTALIPQSDAA